MFWHIEAGTKWLPLSRRHFQVNFLEWNVWISITFSLWFVPNVRINNILALVQIMACRLVGTKALAEPMMVSVLKHICVTWPQWVNEKKIMLLFLLQLKTSFLKISFPIYFWEQINTHHITRHGFLIHTHSTSTHFIPHCFLFIQSTHWLLEDVGEHKFMSASCETAVWMLQNTFDDKSTLVQVVVLSSNKPLPEPILTQVYVIWCH